MKPAVLALLQCFGHALAGFGFPSDVIVLAVRWYLRFGLSSRDVELHRLLPLLLQACGSWRDRDVVIATDRPIANDADLAKCFLRVVACPG